MAISCITTVKATFRLGNNFFTFLQNREDGNSYEKEEFLECAKLADYEVQSAWKRLPLRPMSAFLLSTPLDVSRTAGDTLEISWTSNPLLFSGKSSFEAWERRLRDTLEQKAQLTFVQEDFSAAETAELEVLYAINDTIQSIPLYSEYKAARTKIPSSGLTLDIRPLMKEGSEQVAMRWKADNVIPLK